MNWHSLWGTKRFLKKQKQKWGKYKRKSHYPREDTFLKDRKRTRDQPCFLNPSTRKSEFVTINKRVSEVNENWHQTCCRPFLITEHLEASLPNWWRSASITYGLVMPRMWTLTWRSPFQEFPSPEPWSSIVKGNVEMLKWVCPLMDEETEVQGAQGLAWGPTVNSWHWRLGLGHKCSIKGWRANT